jgi:hypothetical protein
MSLKDRIVGSIKLDLVLQNISEIWARPSVRAERDGGDAGVCAILWTAGKAYQALLRQDCAGKDGMRSWRGVVTEVTVDSWPACWWVGGRRHGLCIHVITTVNDSYGSRNVRIVHEST